MQQRIANIIYLATSIAACAFVVLGVIAFFDLRQRFDMGHTLGVTAAVMIGIPLSLWGAGWAIRYILVGTKTFKPEL